MKRVIPFLWLVIAVCLAGCSNDASDATDMTPEQQAAKLKTVEISWEQLMPKGEEERLEALYSQYYAELERQFQEDAEALASGNLPEGESQDLVAAIVEGSANDTMEQIGTYNTVPELNGQSVRIPGYVVPFDFSADALYTEFLLVPYFGACLHTPPPPPNQIVFVKAEPGALIADLYEPVWVEGVLKTGQFDSTLGNSAYELTLKKVEAYAY
ncbi:MAG: DUF3299 domain-containing protein [Pseudomonadota bacterium]